MAAFALASLVNSQALACTRFPAFGNGGQYVGGDLAEQIASKAHTIQLVRSSSLSG